MPQWLCLVSLSYAYFCMTKAILSALSSACPTVRPSVRPPIHALLSIFHPSKIKKFKNYVKKKKMLGTTINVMR